MNKKDKVICFYNKEMINSKCSEKVIKKKKRSPIILVPDVDNKFNYKQRSMNELK